MLAHALAQSNVYICTICTVERKAGRFEKVVEINGCLNPSQTETNPNSGLQWNVAIGDIFINQTLKTRSVTFYQNKIN